MLSSKPKKPVRALVPLCHWKAIPLSLLSSALGAAPAAPPPIVIIGSLTLVIVESTVIVVPWTVKFPVSITLLALKSPLPSLYTRVLTVLLLVPLDVTVNVDPLPVALPLKPKPAVAPL